MILQTNVAVKVEFEDTNNQIRATDAAIKVEYEDTNNKILMTNDAIKIEFADTNNKILVTDAAIKVEYWDVLYPDDCVHLHYVDGDINLEDIEWIGDTGLVVFQYVYEDLETYSAISESIAGAFTVGCWVWFYGGSSGVPMGIVSKWLESGNERQFVLYKNSEDAFVFSVSEDGSAVVSITDESRNFVVEKWYYVVGRYTPGEEIALFISGQWYRNTTNIPASLHNSIQALEFWRYNASNYLNGHVSHGFLSAEAVEDYYIEANYSHSKAMFSPGLFWSSSSSSSSNTSSSSTTTSSSSYSSSSTSSSSTTTSSSSSSVPP